MNLLQLFNIGIYPGDRVVFKKSGTPGKVLEIASDSAFVEFIGNKTGRVWQEWVFKSKLRKIRGEE